MLSLVVPLNCCLVIVEPLAALPEGQCDLRLSCCIFPFAHLLPGSMICCYGLLPVRRLLPRLSRLRIQPGAFRLLTRPLRRFAPALSGPGVLLRFECCPTSVVFDLHVIRQFRTSG